MEQNHYLGLVMLRFNKAIVREYTTSILYALCIAFVFRSFAFEAYRIPSSSMEPNLLIGDHLFVSKYSYGYSKYSMMPGIMPVDYVVKNTIGKLLKDRIFFREPRRGDIIVFRLPKDDRINYIKRLVGLPGDNIIVMNNDLYINGDRVVENKNGYYTFIDNGHPYVLDSYEELLPESTSHIIAKLPFNTSMFNSGTKKFTVPAGHYFFMGDNRDFSKDSRFDDVGLVPAQNILGRAEFLFWTSKVIPNLLQLKQDPRWFMRLHS